MEPKTTTNRHAVVEELGGQSQEGVEGTCQDSLSEHLSDPYDFYIS